MEKGFCPKLLLLPQLLPPLRDFYLYRCCSQRAFVDCQFFSYHLVDQKIERIIEFKNSRYESGFSQVQTMSLVDEFSSFFRTKSSRNSNIDATQGGEFQLVLVQSEVSSLGFEFSILHRRRFKSDSYFFERQKFKTTSTETSLETEKAEKASKTKWRQRR